MEKRIANVISYLFHPILIPTYAFMILFSQKAYFAMVLPVPAKLRLLLIVFVLTCVLPLSIVLMLKHWRFITTIQMYDRKERNLPFVVMIVFNSFLYFLLRNIQISPVFKYFVLGTVLLIAIAFIVNLKWKISIHMMAIGGLLGMVLGLTLLSIITNPIYLLGVITCAGFTGFARLKLNIHTQAQVYTGLLSGITLMMILALYF
jgi:hypothetical protein